MTERGSDPFFGKGVYIFLFILNPLLICLVYPSKDDRSFIRVWVDVLVDVRVGIDLHVHVRTYRARYRDLDTELDEIAQHSIA